jgi:hypothetical protein
VTGYDGITNYVHMLGTGHLPYFHEKMRNLNSLSNQGWESYNALVASYYHHTTKGGEKDDHFSKLLSIVHLIARMMMWGTGG